MADNQEVDHVKRFCDVIRMDMKSLNLSNENANNKAVWSRAIMSKKLIKHVGVLSSMWIMDVEPLTIMMYYF